eukprot:9344487-Alexandrium_andersonii.AAC.1
MSASLVGSEMCIRDRPTYHRTNEHTRATRGSTVEAMEATVRSRKRPRPPPREPLATACSLDVRLLLYSMLVLKVPARIIYLVFVL